MTDEKRFSTSQAARMLRISRQRIHQLIDQGRIEVTIDPLSGWQVITLRELKRFQRFGRLTPGRPRKNNGDCPELS